MPDDESEGAKRIAQAYRASGIAAKVHGGMLFIERDEGWEGPIFPASVQSTYAEDIRAIEGRVRRAASQVLENLNDAERSFMAERSGHVSQYLTDPARYMRLGCDERTARRHVAVVTSLKLWKEFWA